MLNLMYLSNNNIYIYTYILSECGFSEFNLCIYAIISFYANPALSINILGIISNAYAYYLYAY